MELTPTTIAGRLSADLLLIEGYCELAVLGEDLTEEHWEFLLTMRRAAEEFRKRLVGFATTPVVAVRRA
jgi:hypothetical protein